MNLRRSLLLLFAFLFILPAVLLARGHAPAAASAAPASPTDLTPAPFSIRWSPYNSLAHSPGSLAFIDPVNGHLFFQETDVMVVKDSADGALVQRLGLNVLGRTFSADYSRLYLTTYLSTDAVTIHSYDAATLAPIRSIPYACKPGYYVCSYGAIAEGPDDRLYISRTNEAAIDVVDATSGAVLHRFVVIDNAYDGHLLLAAAGQTLFVGKNGSYGGQAGLARYDISQPLPVAIDFYPMTPYVALTLAPGGDYLAARAGENLYVFRVAPFELLQHIPTGGVEFVGLYPDGGILLYEPIAPYHRLLAVIDPHTGQTTRSGRVGDAGRLLLLSDGGVAHDFYDQVTLYRPTDYAAVIQTTWHNACPGGPLSDFFDNPSSGWPIFDNDFAAVGYVNRGYQIEMRRPQTTLGVSRGDVWDNSLAFEVVGIQPINQVGTYGILFGLNDDWTEFYTVEVFPAAGQWLVLRYAGGQWAELERGSYHPSPGTGAHFKLVRDLETDWTIINLGDSRIYDVPPGLTGRIGLVATAVRAPIHALFDNYVFTDTYCNGPLPARSAAATTDAAPAAPTAAPLEVVVLPPRPAWPAEVMP